MTGSGMTSSFKPVLDRLIQNTEIKPMVVAFPTLNTLSPSTNSLNLHMFIDSPINGNVGTAITQDLMDYLAANYNIATTREERAIGGFSMGGYGAPRIAITNSDKFGAFVADEPFMLAVEEFRQTYLQELLKKYGLKPPYDFNVDPSNPWAHIEAYLWLGVATAF